MAIKKEITEKKPKIQENIGYADKSERKIQVMKDEPDDENKGSKRNFNFNYYQEHELDGKKAINFEPSEDWKENYERDRKKN